MWRIVVSFGVLDVKEFIMSLVSLYVLIVLKDYNVMLVVDEIIYLCKLKWR